VNNYIGFLSFQKGNCDKSCKVSSCVMVMHMKWLYGKREETNFRAEEIIYHVHMQWNPQLMFLCLRFPSSCVLFQLAQINISVSLPPCKIFLSLEFKSTAPKRKPTYEFHCTGMYHGIILFGNYSKNMSK
jgi:hypothetical protein